MTTVLIAAGGTAGHVVPALAVADKLRADGASVVFVGGRRAERTLVPEAGYELREIAVEGLSRSNPLKAARGLARAVGAFRASRRILREVGPDVVLGGGGYVAGPVGLAAVRAGVPLVLTEADSHLGLTNRLLAARAKRVCLAFEIDGRTGPRYRVTGRPVSAPFENRAHARSQFGIDEGERCVLVFGGSLGARSINEAAIAGLTDLPPGVHILHVCGERDYASLAPRAPVERYDLRAYIEDFGAALAAADLCVARAGGSVFEIAANGLPAILVPYPHAAADHQAGNARWMADAGAAVVVRDEDLTPQGLRSRVLDLLADPGRLGDMAAASGALARPDAAREIADEVLSAAKGASR